MKDEDMAKYQYSTADSKMFYSPTYAKNYCPNCGSKDIAHHEQIVFGNVGRIDEASCNNCGCHF